MLERTRVAILVLLLPRLVRWTADGLEALAEAVAGTVRVRDGRVEVSPPMDGLGLDRWRVAHVLEAAEAAAHVYDCITDVFKNGTRVEGIEPATRRPRG